MALLLVKDVAPYHCPPLVRSWLAWYTANRKT